MAKMEMYVISMDGDMINLKDRDLIIREFSNGWEVIARSQYNNGQSYTIGTYPDETKAKETVKKIANAISSITAKIVDIAEI
jgi:hypothetical protein